MSKKIVISQFNNAATILQNNKIQEIITVNSVYQVNDIYLGIVHKIFASINAAFVNLGTNKKSGFIHVNDIKCLKKHRYTAGITDILSIDQLVLVQIVKEPAFNKGPRLTASINLFGRYLVLTPFSDTINISAKIYDQNERFYLQSLAVIFKPIGMGLLIRSSASGISEEVFLKDLSSLKRQWCFIQKLASNSSFPCLLYKDEDLVKKVIRDFYSNDIQLITADSSDALSQAHYYLNYWECMSLNSDLKLRLFHQAESILERFGISLAIIDALKSKVNLATGGYLFIESYEALTVVDVNSGSFDQATNPAENVLRTNCYAAVEIAYQLKLRNINGVIVVDFIDMESHRDQLQLLEHFSRLLSTDSAMPRIVQLSRLGLVELTRRRREQSLSELFHCRYKKSHFLPLTSLVFTRKSLRSYDLVNKGINALFFNIFFYNNLYISRYLVYQINRLEVISLYQDKLLYSPYNFTVSLPLYSRVVNYSFWQR